MMREFPCTTEISRTVYDARHAMHKVLKGDRTIGWS